jgi:hypothetical protein
VTIATHNQLQTILILSSSFAVATFADATFADATFADATVSGA